MAIVDLLAHRDREDDAEAFDEVLLVIAVENDGVDQADGLRARVEIEAHREGQPLAGTIRRACERLRS